jgi:hypothetical protein
MTISFEDFDPKTLVFHNLKEEHFGKRIVLKRQEDNKFLPLIFSSPEEQYDIPENWDSFLFNVFPKGVANSYSALVFFNNSKGETTQNQRIGLTSSRKK